MKRRVSLREANQHLSRYVDEAERGAEVIITRRGKPVARLLAVPEDHVVSVEQKSAWRRLKASARAMRIGKFNRDAAHER